MLDIRIQNGLLELLKQKPLNDITTKDIIESAEASRKTFYTYYKDKTRPVNGNWRGDHYRLTRGPKRGP